MTKATPGGDVIRVLIVDDHRLFADAIQPAGRVGLLADVDGVRGVRLHPERQLLGVDAGGQLGVVRIV